ncbi:MAG: YqaE/Pmp3 family membrane protein [Phaeodactylibacter sp.]|uniref:YqaE/Pmp3 family membrane protein n=1 Tax=Phaeodactylibacter sp. TaxID=1940289 RepID=UPI0032EAD426
MKGLLLSLTLMFGLLAAVPTQAAIAVEAAATTTAVEEAPTLTKKALRKKKRQERRAKRKAIRTAVKDWRKADLSDDTLLLIIITILLPPLGMFLYEGDFTTRVLISLLLWLLFYLPGLIYTLVVILG